MAMVMVTAGSPAAHARVFMTQQQALASAFPAGTKVTRHVFFLTSGQLAAAKTESGLDCTGQMIVRYTGRGPAGLVGHAYFDTHRVRTLPETVMILISPANRIERIELLSFDEPAEYQPRPRWLQQIRGRRLDDDLSLKRAIRPITGASLSARSIVNASRRILAIHNAIGRS